MIPQLTRSVPFAVFACVLAAMASCGSPRQAVEEPGPPAGESSDEGGWHPPAPAPDDFDWIRHTSGEWLKGDIDLLRYGRLQFDSDKMGEQEFDIEDIAELRSPRINSCQFKGNIKLVGTVLMRGGYVVVGDKEEQCFPRSQLLTILPGEPRERNYWTGKLSVGLSTWSGNTDQQQINGTVNIERRTLATVVGLDYSGNYGEVDGVESANHHSLRETYQVFLTDRLYVSPLSLEAYRDVFQNIDYRLTPGAGLGYYFFDRGDLRWNVVGMGGYQYTKYQSVTAGEDRVDRLPALIALSKYSMDVTQDVDLLLNYSITYPLDNDINPNQHASAGISIELNDTLTLDLTASWDRVGSPQRDSDGNLPEKDDFIFTAGLGIEF